MGARKTKRLGYGDYQCGEYRVRYVGKGETGCELWDVTRDGVTLDTVARKRDAVRLIEDGHYTGWEG